MRGLPLAACCALLLGAADGCDHGDGATPNAPTNPATAGTAGAGGSTTLTAGSAGVASIASASGSAGFSVGAAGGVYSGGAATSGNGGTATAPDAGHQPGNGGVAVTDGATSQSTVLNKMATAKIYAHLMPWFETPESNGTWGIHWKMANQNPDVVDANGKRQIASHYYPLTGPYASGDPALIEYQLLLMKYSGIDGALIDWPGAIDLYDYAKNKANAEAFIARTSAVGLSFAVVYEDQNVNIALGQGAVSDRLAAGQADMTYARDHYFSQNNYIHVNGAPLLLVFGPQTFQAPTDWQSVFSVLPEKPTFLTLWGESAEAGATASGEFAWVVENTTQLASFYAQPPAGVALGAAYPGFDSFYAPGGWAGPTWTIAHDGTNTFAATLDQALAAHVSALQLVTWNDYGEGTVIEPTQELGFSLLTTLQQKLGVNLGQAELELALKLYTERKLHPDDVARQMQLDAAFAALAALHFDEASALLL